MKLVLVLGLAVMSLTSQAFWGESDKCTCIYIDTNSASDLACNNILLRKTVVLSKRDGESCTLTCAERGYADSTWGAIRKCKQAGN